MVNPRSVYLKALVPYLDDLSEKTISGSSQINEQDETIKILL